MSYLDWAIVFLFFAALAFLINALRRYNRSIADFLAANRSAGRYMLTVSQAASSFGAVSALAIFEMHFKAGFSPLFWGLFLLPVQFVISATGWVTYRFRETRAFTLAQFFELRYSRNFRIFMGLVGFLSGIINYGIFPACTAHFFLYFCDLPKTFLLGGFACDTFVVLMAVQLLIALGITLAGGQLTILIGDFLQGQFINVIMLIVLLWLAYIINWQQVKDVFSVAPADASLANPFRTGAVEDFNVWYYAIAAIGAFYATMAWQGSQGFNSSGKSAHETRMGSILGLWRSSLTSFLPPIAAIAAIVVMQHPDFRPIATEVVQRLSGITDPQVRQQMTVPTVLSHVLPIGLLGLFATMMMSATISTDTSYLHSWGSIFVQDVILPILRRPLSPASHMLALRCAIVGVAIFAFFFSLLFRQTENILLFMAATGAIFMGGAGSAIIGGLYWKKGSTAAAWAAMIVGSSIATGGIVAQQLDPEFAFNGQQTFFFAIVASVSIYAVISFIQNKEFNLDRILHRGEYRILLPIEEQSREHTPTGWKAIGPGPDFTRRDRFVLWLTLGMQAFFLCSAVGISVGYFLFRFGDTVWFNIWYTFILISIVKGGIVTVWFLIGGWGDMKTTLELMRIARRNQLDDGTVTGGHNRGEEADAQRK